MSGKLIVDITKSNNEISQFGDNDSGRLFKLSNQETLNYTNIVAAFSGLFSDPEFEQYGKNYPINKQIIQIFSNKDKFIVPSVFQKQYTSNPYKKLKYRKEISIPFYNQVNLDTIQFISYSDFGLHIFKSEYFFLAISSISNEKMHHSWGHVHNDKLSFELHIEGKDIVKDAGSYCYTSNAKMRNQFRSTKAHHSIVIEGVEQNKWIEKSDWGLFFLDREIKCKVVETTENSITLQAKYYGVCHIRNFKISEKELLITDNCNKRFEININKFKKYSAGYGLISEVL